MNPVANDRSDAKLPHLPGRVGDDPVLIVEHDAKAPIGKDLIDVSLDRQQLFFCQGFSFIGRDQPGSRNVPAALPVARGSADRDQADEAVAGQGSEWLRLDLAVTRT